MVETPTALRPDDASVPEARRSGVAAPATDEATGEPTVSTATEQRPLHEWTVHPARDRPLAALGAVAAILALAATAWLTTGTPAWGLFTLGVLFMALVRFFLPTHYAIDADGVSAVHPIAPRRMHWIQIRRCAFDDRGGFLGTRARRTLLDGFTGLQLLYPAGLDAAERSSIESTVRARASAGTGRIVATEDAR